MPKPIFESSKNKIQEMIRVNHAGEFGAKRIYEGQIKYTKDPEQKAIITHMLEQELEHLTYFEDKIKGGTRPTFLIGFWNVTGYLLGAVSASLSYKTAMLVTENVESVIESHYQEQIDYLKQTKFDYEMQQTLTKFMQDEVEHKHIAVDNQSREVVFASLISYIVKNICKTAISISKKF